MQNRRSNRAWWYLLLVIPFIAMLWVPSYTSVAPTIAGFPFFYWYQFLWVVISAGITLIVYLATTRGTPRAGDPDVDSTGGTTHD